MFMNELSDKIKKVGKKKKTPIIFYKSFTKKLNEDKKSKPPVFKKGHHVYLKTRVKSSAEHPDPPRRGTIVHVANDHVLLSPDAMDRTPGKKYYKAKIDNIEHTKSVLDGLNTPVTIKKDDLSEDQRAADYKLIKYRADDGTYHWRKIKRVIDLDNSEGMQ
jgi:hypothetical protein